MKCKAIAMFMAMITLFTAAAGCVQTDKGSDPKTSNASNVETESKETYANLPEVNMNGADMPIFISYNVENVSDLETGISKNEFGADEFNAEAVNDARVERNQIVNAKFNCNIVGFDYNTEVALSHHDSMVNYIDKLLVSGTNDYVFMLIQGYTACQLALRGVLTDLYSYENLALEQPWWDQKANENLTVMDTLYYTTGDISTADNDATCTILFNKALAENYTLPNLYDTVKEDKWTLDLLLSYAAMASEDLNGDGKRTDEDQYGAIVWDDITMAMVNSTGEKCAKVDEEGKIALTLNSERTIDVLTRWTTFGRNTTECYQYQYVSSSDTLAIKLFSNNQGLFLMQLMQIVPKMRDMETDFGILPIPKYDEDQAEYYNMVGSWHSVFFCMPYGNADKTNASILAEALAYEGKNTVTPAYYEKTLIGKSTRDEESADMLDIIFDTRVYDLGWYYQFGEYNIGVMNMFRRSARKKEFASMYKSQEEAALTKVEEVNLAYANVTGK